MRRKSFWFAALGTALMAYASYGNGNFFPSFLYRVHGMGLAEIGYTLALVSGITGAVGTFLGGFFADKFGQKDKRWYLWVPMWGALIHIPLAIFVLITPNVNALIGVLILSNISGAMYLGPCIAISHFLVPAHMRAMTSAILFFVLNMIGLGLGPLATGLMSDAFGVHYGVEGLRYAMLVSACIGGIPVILFYLAAKHLRKDLAMLHEARD
jgi:MFS family permease